MGRALLALVVAEEHPPVLARFDEGLRLAVGENLDEAHHYCDKILVLKQPLHFVRYPVLALLFLFAHVL